MGHTCILCGNNHRIVIMPKIPPRSKWNDKDTLNESDGVELYESRNVGTNRYYGHERRSWKKQRKHQTHGLVERVSVKQLAIEGGVYGRETELGERIEDSADFG
jgi:hypothetical protein